MDAVERLSQVVKLGQSPELEYDEAEQQRVLSPRLRFTEDRVYPIHITRDVNDSRIYYASVTVR